MPEEVLVFGKDTGPFTTAAREAFAKEGRTVNYFNILDDQEHLKLMLQHSAGKRKIPVIVRGDVVTIGFEGKYGRV